MIYTYMQMRNLCVQEQNCTSPASSRGMPVSTSAPAKTSAALTGATLKLLSQVCMRITVTLRERFFFPDAAC